MDFELPEPVDITIAGSADDPRDVSSVPAGVRVHRSPPLHPDDVVTLPGGLRVTSPARTLVDLAEVMSLPELRECFANALERGLVSIDEVNTARARVEWRASLQMLDGLITEFDGG